MLRPHFGQAGSLPLSTARRCRSVGALGLAFGGLLSAGCALRPAAVAVAVPDQAMPLALDQPRPPADSSQTLLAAFGDRAVQMQCTLSVGAADWRTVCINALGLRLLSLGVSADGQISAERGPGVPEQLDPRRILADVQLAFWPLASLQAAYAGSAWQISQPADDTRRLLRDGRLVAEVHYASPDPWNGRLWLVNLRYDYSLAIRSESIPAVSP